jgi:hypothetical protein
MKLSLTLLLLLPLSVFSRLTTLKVRVLKHEDAPLVHIIFQNSNSGRLILLAFITGR